MTEQEFLQEQRRAIERMNEMYKGHQIKTGGYKMPPAPDFVKVNNNDSFAEKSANTAPQSPKSDTENSHSQRSVAGALRTNAKANDLGGGIGLPFLKNGFLDKDISLILGLILILANEKADRRLLLALLYILM